jgi:hypothetical protein
VRESLGRSDDGFSMFGVWVWRSVAGQLQGDALVPSAEVLKCAESRVNFVLFQGDDSSIDCQNSHPVLKLAAEISSAIPSTNSN